MGYSIGQKGWRVYNLRTKEFSVSRDVIFYEDVFPFVTNNKNCTDSIFNNTNSLLQGSIAESEDIVQNSNQEEINQNPIESSASEQDSINIETEAHNQGEMETEPHETMLPATRTRQPSSYLKDYYCHSSVKNPTSRSLENPTDSSTHYPISKYIDYTHFSNKYVAYLAAIPHQEEPKTYAEVAQKKEWQKAMDQEIHALEENRTWDMVTLPKGKKAVRCKWVCKLKYKANGEIEKHKARLVAKGYTQIKGEDFNETFAPVAKMTTIRCLLVVAVARGWKLHQMDMSNAFLHGELDEEVYMEPVLGYHMSKKGMIYRLRKSIYGLKKPQGIGMLNCLSPSYPMALLNLRQTIAYSHICTMTLFFLF